MLIWISVLILLMVTLFYVATKEGMEEKKPLGNQYLDKKAVNIDLDKNSIEIPNHVSGIVSEDLNMGGNIGIENENKLELGKGTKNKGPSSGTLQYKGDYLHMVGAGKDGDKANIKLWDNVEIGSLLQVNDQLSVKGDAIIEGSQTVKKKQILSEGQDVDGLSKHTGKVHINPNEKDQTNMPDLAIGDGLSGFKKLENGVTFTSKAVDIGGFNDGYGGGMFLNKNNVLELGRGVTKEVNAGTISYKRHSPPGGLHDSLDIVGAGEDGIPRKVRLWDDVEVVGGLTVKGPVSMPQLKQSGQFGNVIELSPELYAEGKKESNAGKIGYNVFANDAGETENLGIVGAGKYGTPRKIHMWDDVVVQKDLKVNNNISANTLQVNGDIKQRGQEVPTTIKKRGGGTIGNYINEDKPDSLFFGDNGEYWIKSGGNWAHLGYLNTNEQVDTPKVISKTVTTDVATVTNSLKIGNWYIYEDSDNMLRFSRNGVDKTRLYDTNKVDGIGVVGDGNIWMSRDIYRGWMSQGIKYAIDVAQNATSIGNGARDTANNAREMATAAQETSNEVRNIANNAQKTANNALNKRFIRTGRGGERGGHFGTVMFNPPFDNDIDPRKIRVVATCDYGVWNKREDWWYQIVVHVFEVDRTKFGYSKEGQGNGSPYMFDPGEGFNYIAIAL